jgi:hypothetical protein
VIHEPARRFWKTEDENDDKDSEDNLHSNGKSPRNWSSDERHAVVKPICHNDANGSEEDFRGNEATSGLAITHFCLIPMVFVISIVKSTISQLASRHFNLHWHRRGLQACACTSDQSPYDQMRHSNGGCLQDCADDHDSHCQPDGLSTTETFTDEEIDWIAMLDQIYRQMSPE